VQKFKDIYGEEDRVSNFFTGDHPRPTERIKSIRKQIRYNHPNGPRKTAEAASGGAR
jgi:hypothetical protein